MSRIRLDQELARRDRFVSRSAARNAIRAGFVSVEGAVVTRPGHPVTADTVIRVAAAAGDYVGRGAHKLLAALAGFGVDVTGRCAVDVGSSTGGFTQVLLEAGAAAVVALDVGRAQLHPRLREDPRVEVWEGTNVRDVDVAGLGGPFDVVTVDLSFISLGVVAGDLERLGGTDADWIVLVKPQFEVGKENLAKDGVVRNAGARARAVSDVIEAFSGCGLVTLDALRSPLPGGSGNLEALLWLRREGTPIVSVEAYKVLADE